MRTVLAATLMALLICGSPALIYGAETDQAPGEGTTSVVPDEDAPPPAADAKPDEAAEPRDDQAGSGGDLMKNVTRHRPGACPEGPPCNAEDEDED